MQKTQLSKEEGRALVQRWKSSGKSIQAFCKEHSIPPHKINYWKKQYVKTSPRTVGGSKFIPIELNSKSHTPQYEIQTPGGYLIRIYSNAQLSELVKQLN